MPRQSNATIAVLGIDIGKNTRRRAGPAPAPRPPGRDQLALGLGAPDATDLVFCRHDRDGWPVPIPPNDLRQFGHRDGTVTLKCYVHFFKAGDDQAAALIGEALALPAASPVANSGYVRLIEG